MADVTKINLYGTDYTIKDSTAREKADNAKTTADDAQSTANNAKTNSETNATNITKLSTEGVVITYETANESIKVTKGIDLA